MNLNQLVVCIRDNDGLTKEELLDLEYVADRIETHLDVLGYDAEQFDLDKLAKDVQNELLES